MSHRSQAEIRSRIQQIDQILESGAASANLDGVSVSWDFEELRKERAILADRLPESRKRRRPMFYRNRMG